MNIKIKSFILILFILFLSGCHRKDPGVNLDELNVEGTILRTWRVIGPFVAQSEENEFDTDFLKRFELDENLVQYDELKKLMPENSLVKFKNELLDSVDVLVDFNKIFGFKADSTVRGAAYLACNWYSSKPQRLFLNFASNDGAKIWLNNKLVFSQKQGAEVVPYENYFEIKLNQGTNFFLVKVSNVRRTWQMFAAIERFSKESEIRHKRNFQLRYGNTYLSKNIIENDTLRLAWGMPDESYRLKVVGAKTKTFKIKVNQNIALRDFPDGTYSTQLYARGDTFTSRFIKGKDIVKKIGNRLQNDLSNSRFKGNEILKALKLRYDILMKPENQAKQGFEKRNWDKKMLFIADNLSALTNIAVFPDLNKGEKGCLLKSYTSKIDDGTQFYLIHVPDSYKKDKPMPLVIEMPKLMKRFDSPLETHRFANISFLDHLDVLANKFGMIILEAGNRTIDRSNYNDIDEADFFEAINDLKKNYAIDTTRIYLRGACRAAFDALKLAVRYPDKFAAISTVSPEIAPSRQQECRSVKQRSPIQLLNNIKHLPFYNIHSKLDTHSRISISEMFNGLTKRANFKSFFYRRLPMEFKPYYSEEYLEDEFRFFSKCPKLKQPDYVNLSTYELKHGKAFWISIDKINYKGKSVIDAKLNDNVLIVTTSNVLSYKIDLLRLPFDRSRPLTIRNNGKCFLSRIIKEKEILINTSITDRFIYQKNRKIEGPFAHVFTDSFIVVQGTGGTKYDKVQIAEMVKFLNSHWRRRYYANFRIKKDTEIKENEIASSNLILIGSQISNLFYKKLANTLPIDVGPTSVKIGKRKVEGNSLGYYFINPNPLNSKKYLAILGYNNPAYFRVWAEGGNNRLFNDISNYGWYDYSIWNNQFSKAVVKGYFDNNWR